MRRRILGVAVTAALVAILLFAVPLALAVRTTFVSNERVELERAALRAAAVVEPPLAAGSEVVVPATEPDMAAGVYDAQGSLVAGRGPAGPDSALRAALAGHAAQTEEGGAMVAAIPVLSDGRVIGAVRTATASSAIWRRTALTWGAMVALAVLAMTIAVAVAARLASRLNRPLVSLANAAQMLGEGDFTVRADVSGVPEIDRSATALNQTAQRLDRMVERERAFSANASHQLRTPLTGLRLRLESALAQPDADLAAAARDAIGSADRLEATIEDLLRLSHGELPEARTWAFAELLGPLAERWTTECAAQGRDLAVRAEDEAPDVVASPHAVAHVLDVLVDNALRHGKGRIDVVARAAGAVAAVDVRDEGGGLDGGTRDIFRRGVSGDGGPGIGLALARELVQGQRGRLLLTHTTPSTVFTVLLPAAPTDG